MSATTGTSAHQGNHEPETEFMDLLAYIYLQNGQPGKAATLLEARDIVFPDDPKALLMLALAQLRCGKFPRALETLDRLALQGGISAAFHLMRAQALQALERNDEAASAMRAYVDARVQSEPRPSKPSMASNSPASTSRSASARVAATAD